MVRSKQSMIESNGLITCVCKQLEHLSVNPTQNPLFVGSCPIFGHARSHRYLNLLFLIIYNSSSLQTDVSKLKGNFLVILCYAKRISGSGGWILELPRTEDSQEFRKESVNFFKESRLILV